MTDHREPSLRAAVSGQMEVGGRSIQKRVVLLHPFSMQGKRHSRASGGTIPFGSDDCPRFVTASATGP